MSIVRTALPLILVSSVLTGCAGLQKTDWPMCAAVGGVTGAALGAIESGSLAAGVGAAAAGVGAAYCWVHGDGDEDGDGVPDSRDNGCPPPAPAPMPVAAEPAPMPKEETIVIRNVHFEFDKATLTAADRAQLDTVASRLKTEATTARLSVSGHTDSVGKDAYNQRLSEQRAKAVTDYLVSSGVPRASVVSVKGVGEAQPVADNNTADGRAMNRRTEILIQR
jgi:OOP family OmpA-OmpF porin